MAAVKSSGGVRVGWRLLRIRGGRVVFTAEDQKIAQHSKVKNIYAMRHGRLQYFTHHEIVSILSKCIH